jgi:hypothetical protein
MPQWKRDNDKLRQRYPDERSIASCPRELSGPLRRADHHVVQIDGRAALLLTYRWDEIPETDWPDHLSCEVSFTYPAGHPSAPDAVQRIVDSLSFTPLAPGDS